MRRVARAAVLFALWAGSAGAWPHVGAELAVQHARESSGGTFDPVGFPISGAGALTVRWPALSRLDLTTGIGYEDRGTRDRLTVTIQPGGTFSVDSQNQWRSIVVPIHASIPVRGGLRLEAGPEWRWLLQSRTRPVGESPAFVFGQPPALSSSSTIFESASRWTDTTQGFDRSSFALSLGLAFGFDALGGAARAGLRYCELLGNQRRPNDFEVESRFRQYQLVLGWDR